MDRIYYLRHRIETIKRIRLTARIDALALARLVEDDYESARKWSAYAAEELQHDRMFLADLAKHGLSEESVLAVQPLRSTVELVTFLDRQLATVGPLAAVAYSVFVEWNSARYSAPAVARAEEAFGPDFVTGSKAHLTIDVDDGHYGMMVWIAHRLTRQPGAEERFAFLLRSFGELFRAYFRELADCRTL